MTIYWNYHVESKLVNNLLRYIKTIYNPNKEISISKNDISVDTMSDVLIRVNNLDWILMSKPKIIEMDETIVTISDSTHRPQIIPVIIRINFSFTFMQLLFR